LQQQLSQLIQKQEQQRAQRVPLQLALDETRLEQQTPADHMQQKLALIDEQITPLDQHIAHCQATQAERRQASETSSPSSARSRKRR